MANLSIQYQRIGESGYVDYTDSIKNIHQYGGVDLRVYKTMSDSFVTVKIDKYPDIKLCESSTTYEWKPNQWLFVNEEGIYENCMDYFDSDAEYFLFPSEYFNNSNRFDFVVSPIFNVAGRYVIVISEYIAEDNSIIGSKTVYIEVTDIKTSYLTTPFNGESNEFNGWNTALSKDVLGLLKNVGNNFVMCFYEGDKSFDEMIGSLCCVDSEIYAGYTDNFFNINNEDYNEKNVYGVITEAFIDHCFIRDNAYDNFVKEVKICKLAFAGTYNINLSSTEFSQSGYVYFDSTNMRITSDSSKGGKIVGIYDAERQIIQLSQGFTYGDINSITGDIGDMLVMGANGWERLPHGEAGEVLTIENISGTSDQYIPYPVWRQTSSIHNSYSQFVSPQFEFKFSIGEGDTLKFSEIYNENSICIEESGLKGFYLNDGNVYLGEAAVIGNYITTNPNDIPNLETETFNVYEVNGITYFVVDKEDLPPTILPDGLSLIKYSRKGAVCSEVNKDIEYDDTNIGKYLPNQLNSECVGDKFFSAGENTSLVWNLSNNLDNADVANSIYFRLLNLNNNVIMDSGVLCERPTTSPYTDFDFYGIGGMKGIIAMVEREDSGYPYFIRLYTNIKNDFVNYEDFSDFVDIDVCENTADKIYGLKIIKHSNFYSLYYIKFDSLQNVYSVGCTSFFVNYEDGVSVIKTTFTDSFNYNEEIDEFTDMDELFMKFHFYVSSINDTNDVILIPTYDENDKQNWKMLISSEVNSLGEMSITYFNDFDSSVFNIDSTDVKGMSITKVKDNICAVALESKATDGNSQSYYFNYIKLLVYNESFDEFSNGVKKSIDIVETEDYNSGYNMNHLCSPIMDSYPAHYDENGSDLQKFSYNQFIKIKDIGRDSFAVFYTAKDIESSNSDVWLRCAIGTVNMRIDELGQKHFDIFWQEIKDSITTIDITKEFCVKDVVKCTNANGDETLLISVQSIEQIADTDEYNLTNRIFTLKFSPVYENNVMGIAGDFVDNKRFICYAGEVDITDSDFENLRIGQNLYCDDFGNLTTIPTENYIGQYIGNNRIVKK